MKKLFVSILALAAFVACQSDFTSEIEYNAPQYNGSENVGGSHIVYAEVGVGAADTKATYGEGLKATWEEGDQLALLQEHADYGKPFGVVNKLNIKEGWGTNYAAFNGDISVDATSPRVYHMAYPAEAVSFVASLSLTKNGETTYAYNDGSYQCGYWYGSANFNYVYETSLNITVPTTQNGKWTPYMYASTSESVASYGIGAKTLTTLTGAVAIRVFEADGVTPKQLKSITITSSDAAIAGTFTGVSTSAASMSITGDATSKEYSVVSAGDIAWYEGYTKGKAAAEELLVAKAQAYEPTSTTVVEPMSLSFTGNEKSITLTNLESVAMDAEGYYTYYVNVAPATVGTLEIKATDVNNGEIMREVSNQTFVASHRKGYMLTWEDATMVPGVVETWYDNWNSSSFELAGNTIYVRNFGVNGVTADHILTLGVEINGQLHEASAKSGVVSVDEIKIEGVENGAYEVCTYAKIILNGYEKVLKSDVETVVVTAIPTASYTIYSSYSNNGEQSLRNDINGSELRASVALSDSYIQQNYVQSATLTYGSSSAAMTVGQEWKSAVSYDAHNTSIKVVLKNGYTLTSPNYITHVTGIPFTMTTSSNADGWSEDGNVKWNTSGGVQLGKNQFSGSASITKTFHIPAALTVKVSSNGIVNGTGSLVKVENTATVTVGSTTVASKTQNGKSEASWSCSNANASMSSSSNTVKVNSSYNLESAKVVVKALTIQY